MTSSSARSGSIRAIPTMLRAVDEVILVWLAIKILTKAYFATPIAGREVDLLHWPYSVQLLQLGVALAMVGLFHRSWRTYGLVPNWRADLRVGGSLALLFIVVPMAAMALFGGLIPESRRVDAVISTVIFQFFLSGIGEEIVFRGYMQSRLNQAFGKPWRVGGFAIGPGLLITALLFGLGHALGGFNPFVHSYQIDILAAVITTVAALLYGLVREKTGSVLGAGILHGHEAVIENFVVTGPGMIGYAVCYILAFVGLLGWRGLWSDRRPTEDR